MTFFKQLYLLIRDNGMYRTKLIVQTYEKGQKQPSSHSRTELGKNTVFPCIVKLFLL